VRLSLMPPQICNLCRDAAPRFSICHSERSEESWQDLRVLRTNAESAIPNPRYAS